MIPTIITSSKGRLEFLKRALPTWLDHTPCDIVVADFACPDGTRDWAATLGPRVWPIAVATLFPEAPFNKSMALNRATAGSTIAPIPQDFLLFLDADTLVTPHFWPWLKSRVFTTTLLISEPHPDYRDLTGVLGVARPHFLAVNGFDEGMIGWGSEDLDLRLRLYLSCPVGITTIPPGLLQSIPHDDALRTRFYAEQDKMASHQRNLQRLCDNAERITGQSIFSLFHSDPLLLRLFGQGMARQPLGQQDET